MRNEGKTKRQLTRELDRVHTEMPANIIHEVRTALASIKGYTNILLDYDKRLKNNEKREYLKIIDRNTDRLTDLTKHLWEK